MRDELFYLNDEHLADELSKLERDQLIEKVTSLVKDKRELIKKYEWIESRYFDFAASVDYDLNIGLKMQRGRKIDRADNLSKALTITIHRWYDQYDKFPTWKQALYGLAIDGHSNIQEIGWETEETGTGGCSPCLPSTDSRQKCRIAPQSARRVDQVAWDV